LLIAALANLSTVLLFDEVDRPDDDPEGDLEELFLAGFAMSLFSLRRVRKTLMHVTVPE
jgi:hypothetical protein